MQQYNEFVFPTKQEERYNFETKKLNRDSIDMVVYHDRCQDGFTSALSAWLYLVREKKRDDIVFYPAYYGKTDQKELLEMMKNKNVLVCDFSFPRDLTMEMIKVTNGNFLILDHHKTAKEDLKDIPPENVVFDMTESGASLTWFYFFGFQNIPRHIMYVKDSDLWEFKLPLSQEYRAYLSESKFEFEEYAKFLDNQYIKDTVIPAGMGIIKQQKYYIENSAMRARNLFILIDNRYYMVSCVRSLFYKSELGNYLVCENKNVNFSAILTPQYEYNTTTISLRSTNQMTDVSMIAKIYGGGGHRNASGLKVEHITDQMPGRVIDTGNLYKKLSDIYTITIADHKFILCNTSFYKEHLAHYLMQERFVGTVEGKNRNQEGLYIRRNITNDSKLDEIYSGAVVWNSTGTNINMKVKLSEDLFNQAKSKAILKNIYDIKFYKNCIISCRLPVTLSSQHNTEIINFLTQTTEA